MLYFNKEIIKQGYNNQNIEMKKEPCISIKTKMFIGLDNFYKKN